jgi:hypothetical protein
MASMTLRGTLGDVSLPLPGTIVVRPPTTGPWFDVPGAAEFRKAAFPPTALQSPTVFMVDLNSVYPVADVLREYVVTLAREIRDGVHGSVSLVVDTRNLSIRHELGYLAGTYQLPLFLASPQSPLSVAHAEPAGLTPSESETLEVVAEMGGRITAPSLAKRLDLKHTAALNRLTPLVEKGFLYRKRRPGRAPDLFGDPRFPDADDVAERILEATKTELPAAEQETLASHLHDHPAAESLPDNF